MKIFVTGGAGYIGSHTIVELLKNNYDVITIDNLCNSSKIALDRVKKITGKNIKFYKCDLKDKSSVNSIFANNSIDAVIHFAGLKSLAESIIYPEKYYRNNVLGSKNLLECMKKFNVKKLVFSSSASIYGEKNRPPFKEHMVDGNLLNPYAKNKFEIENLIKKNYVNDQDLSAINLRYFNPIGADKSGLIGEDPNYAVGNLVPYIMSTALGRKKEFFVYGYDYDTHDGTGIRDYIHIADLVSGHISALNKLNSFMGVKDVNLGTGVGYSVLDLIKTFEQISGKSISYKFSRRRRGDVASSYADVSLAKSFLNWSSKESIQSMCRDAWSWIVKNPNGYS